MATTELRRRSGSGRLAAEAWALLFEFMMSLDPYWDELAGEFDLPASQGHALILLEPGRPQAMSHLAAKCHCDPSNLTGIVDRLETRELVERRTDEHDRRVKLIALTPAGKKLRERVLARVYEPHPAIAALTALDQRALRDILRKALDREAG